MEIKVGDYIRYFKDGTILKVNKYNKDFYNYLLEDEEGLFKYGTNIIDVIEIGDIVNNEVITNITEDPLVVWVDKVKKDSNGNLIRIGYENKDIKTITTHEQIKRMEYKV